MVHGPRENVGDRFDAPMRMPWETREIVVRAVVPEIVEEEKGIELVRFSETEGAAQLDPRTLHGGLRFDDALHGSDRHDL
jgi:hypothetical protein